MISKISACTWCLSVALLTPAAGATSERVLSPSMLRVSVPTQGGDDCSDGVVKDDGSLETGYGWVPSAVDGRYVQRFDVFELESRKLAEVCICWTRTQPDDEIRFQVQLYRSRGDVPARHPEASFEAVATGVPQFPDGAFYSIDVSAADMRIPTDVFFVGVQWDPSDDQFFFVCADHSDVMPVVDGWFIDDRAGDWTSVLETSDPIFAEHRAMMIRARGVEGYFALIPTMGTFGVVVMVIALALVAGLVLRRREE
jgi:hypothetical protein